MHRKTILSALFVLLALVTPVGDQRLMAQENDLLAAGTPVPDFSLPGATRYGVLDDAVRLSDYRGETVVLAFFFRVRTPG